MRILVSNDDGVYSPGINCLANALSKIADVTVVAPDRDRSGASNSLTLTRPLRTHRLSNGFISVEGTPTDCVHLAITGLLDETPDMVVSGINHGANLSDDVLYSGTVAAAIEGRYLGFPAIAVSQVSSDPKHFETAAEIACRLVLRLQSKPLPIKTILNVNVPDLALPEIRGVEITRLGTRHGAEPTIKSVDPRGHTIYWVGPPGEQQDAGIGTDFYAVNSNRVSITPLQLDFTHYNIFNELSNWTKELI